MGAVVVHGAQDRVALARVGKSDAKYSGWRSSNGMATAQRASGPVGYL
jgi:hypothetical protein